MAGCKIVKASMETTVDEMQKVSTKYKTAGETLIQGLDNAIADMEGAAKDELKKFIDTDVKQYVEEEIPGAVTGLSELLKNNLENFVELDKQIAQNMSGN